MRGNAFHFVEALKKYSSHLKGGVMKRSQRFSDDVLVIGDLIEGKCVSVVFVCCRPMLSEADYWKLFPSFQKRMPIVQCSLRLTIERYYPHPKMADVQSSSRPTIELLLSPLSWAMSSPLQRWMSSLTSFSSL